MSKNKRCCRVCGDKKKMMCRKNSAWCSNLCEKKECGPIGNYIRSLVYVFRDDAGNVVTRSEQ